MTKLNLNCGGDIIKNYINLDTTPSSPEVRKVRDYKTLGFNNNSIENIRAINLLNQIKLEDLSATLKHWYDILHEDGEIYIETPDVELICRAVSYGHMNIEEFNNLIYGFERKTAFSLAYLVNVLNQFGFKINEKGYMHYSAFLRVGK